MTHLRPGRLLAWLGALVCLGCGPVVERRAVSTPPPSRTWLAVFMVGVLLAGLWLIYYGIRRGIIERHTHGRYAENFGRDALWHGVALVVAGGAFAAFAIFILLGAR